MKNLFNKVPISSLRDAYKIAGFHVRAKADGYDELKHPAFVLTLDRRSKKRCATGVERFADAFTASGGVVCGILIAGTGKFISIFKCAESTVRRVA